MLVCATAATAPNTIEAMAMKIRICCQSAAILPGKATTSTRASRPSAAALGAAEKKAATGVGAPSYTSGVHMWNGTAETLKARPDRMKTMPNSRPMERSVWPETTPAITSSWVEPEKP